MSLSGTDTPRPGAALARLGGAGALLLLTVAALPVFWLGFGALFAAWSTPEYSHGPLIPLISLYLFLRERADQPPGSQAPARIGPGLLLLLAALAVGVAGTVLRIPVIVSYGLILWVGAVVLIGFGWDRGRRHWAPVVHLVFMLPLPQFLYWKLTLFLQGVSSEMGVWIVALAGVPVYLEGHVIDLGVYRLQVAEACSGLRYLFPILSFSYLVALLYRGPYWHRVLIFVAAAPLTVVMNAVRIGVIGVLVDRFGIGHAEGFLHVFEGWVIFLVCVAILLALAAVLQRLAPTSRPLAEALDLRFDGLGREAAAIARIGAPAAARLGIGALVALAVVVAVLAVPRPEPVAVDREPFALFPRALGDWRGVHHPLEVEVAEVLGASDYLNATYLATGGQAVHLFVAFYDRQTDGAGIHSPEVCLPAGGWEVSALARHQMTLPGQPAFAVNRAVIDRGMERQLVFYWFEQRGARMTNDFAVKFALVRDGLLTGRTDGALVRLVTPIAPGEDIARAEARLTAFLSVLLPELPPFVPGG
jgi:exosortase D (VPLPA-CTERM-specific)